MGIKLPFERISKTNDKGEFWIKGVKKGAFTAEVAEEKFNAWAADKSNKTTAELNQLTQAKNDAKRARLAEEAKQKEAKAAKVDLFKNFKNQTIDK